MKRISSFVFAGAAAMALSACGSADDASADAEADTVEMPADAALAGVSEEPVEDAGAEDEAAAGDEAAAAGDAGADVAAAAEAALGEAEEATDAAAE